MKKMAKQLRDWLVVSKTEVYETVHNEITCSKTLDIKIEVIDKETVKRTYLVEM
jgi:hypothetical protein